MSKRNKRNTAESATATMPAPAHAAGPWGQIAKHARLLAVLLVLLATARIVSTYSELSRTTDEQAHIACGMEYLDKGVYRYEPQHPPLTRIMAALLPYLDGSHSWGFPGMWTEGGAILYRSGNYDRTLALARAGMLPFFWIACLVVYLWGSRYFDRVTGLMALALFTFTPTVLAHAGLATTDMGAAAFCGASLLATLVLLEQPGWRSGLLWGAMLGLAISSKFSFLPFYPSCLLVALVVYFLMERPTARGALAALRPAILPSAVGLVAAFLIVWGIFRFSFGTLLLTGTMRVPFPELFSGINQVMAHNERGHAAFLLGRTSQTGFWYFYPVALFFKLPVGLLVLLATGVIAGWKARSRPVWVLSAFSLGILAVGALTHINVGIRHVLPLLLLFPVLAAVGVKTLLELKQPWMPKLAVGLLAWFAGSSAWVHPDYLAYFNEFALGKPESVLVDSDLDWGQDVKRAGKRLRELGAQSVAFRPGNSFSEDFTEFPPLVDFDPVTPVPGWNLVSATNWKAIRFKIPADVPLWMDRVKPTERVGRGMFLFYVPPPGAPR